MLLPFTPKETARRLRVALKTVIAWRNGARTPGPTAAELLRLYHDGQIIPDAPGWRGFRFDYRAGVLVADNGTALAPGQLSQMRLLLDMLRQHARDMDDAAREIARLEAYIERLECQAPPHLRPANGARWVE